MMRRKINRGTYAHTHTNAHIIPYIILLLPSVSNNDGNSTSAAHIVQSRDAAAAIVRERCSRAAAARDLWRGTTGPDKLVDDKRI